MRPKRGDPKRWRSLYRSLATTVVGLISAVGGTPYQGVVTTARRRRPVRSPRLPAILRPPSGWARSSCCRRCQGTRRVVGDGRYADVKQVYRRLDDGHLARHAADTLQVPQRIGRVVQHAEEQHDVERSADDFGCKLLDGHVLHPHGAPQELVGKVEVATGIAARPIPGPAVGRQDVLGATALRLERVEAVVGTDVEHSPTREVRQPHLNDLCRRVLLAGSADPVPKIDGVEPGSLGDLCVYSARRPPVRQLQIVVPNPIGPPYDMHPDVSRARRPRGRPG